MELYVKHKFVHAAEIVAILQSIEPEPIVTIALKGSGDPVLVDVAWREKNKPDVGGYLVKDENGSLSYMSIEAFLGDYFLYRIGETLPTKVTREALLDRIGRVEYVVMPDQRTTICELTMLNGFTVRGESSCVAVENFNKEEGEKYAREDAIRKAWAFEAYLLAQQRHSEAIRSNLTESAMG